MLQVQFFFPALAASEPVTLSSEVIKLKKAVCAGDGSVLGTALEPLVFVVERRMLHKLLNIMVKSSKVPLGPLIERP